MDNGAYLHLIHTSEGYKYIRSPLLLSGRQRIVDEIVGTNKRERTKARLRKREAHELHGQMKDTIVVIARGEGTLSKILQFNASSNVNAKATSTCRRMIFSSVVEPHLGTRLKTTVCELRGKSPLPPQTLAHSCSPVIEDKRVHNTSHGMSSQAPLSAAQT